MTDVVYVKKWWTSKTLWTNVAIVVAGVLTIISGEISTGATITFAGIINAVLRVMTENGLEF